MEKKKISVVVPCYNEEEVLLLFFHELIDILSNIEYQYEIIFVDDGSSDMTLKIMKDISQKDQMVKFISFSRNFGKEAAIYAGLCNALGDYVVIMDADMQDPPRILQDMIRILETGEYDCVATRRVTRKGEPIIRSLFSRLFYKIINKISDANIMDGARDFRIMKRDMVDAIIRMSEYNRFSKGIFGWVGFRTYWIEYTNCERAAGTTKWSLFGLIQYALDGIVNFSHLPLKLASWFGIFMTIFSFFAILFVIIRKWIWGDPVAGWPSLVCIITFVGGVQLFCMGIMGQYIAKIYMEVKGRPHYIVKECNISDIK